MKKNQINHNALTHLIEAEAVTVIIVKAIGDTWTLTVQVGDTLKIVMAKNSGKPRVWRKLDTLAKYLKNLGITTFHTDVSEYDPSQKSLRRPDSANTLKQTHQSHQSLKKNTLEVVPKIPEITEQKPIEELIDRPQVKINTQQEKAIEVDIESTVVNEEPIKTNATDKAIQIAKERWEYRRAKILKEDNPRAK